MNALFLIVRVAGHRIAFRAADVQSVVELEKLTPAPRTPPFIAGLAALRSRPMTVIDCAHSLELQSQEDVSRTAVVVENDGFLFALRVDGVEDVIEATDTIEPIPAEMDRGWKRAALGMVETPVGILLLANVEALICGPEQQAAA